MKRCTVMGPLILFCASLIGVSVQADQDAVDVNVVTGLDISDSISIDDMKIELAGLAQAIQDPRVLEAIRMRPHRRVGFAVFAWHHGQFPMVVPWMVIGSAEDAIIAARAIDQRALVDMETEARRVEWYVGRLTDLSEAIDHASGMLKTAPFTADRSVINIVGNGDDNVGEDAGPARDRFVRTGGTINGLVLADDPLMVDYYRREAIGGRTAFVMSIRDSTSVADAFVRKFIGDIVASASP